VAVSRDADFAGSPGSGPRCEPRQLPFCSRRREGRFVLNRVKVADLGPNEVRNSVEAGTESPMRVAARGLRSPGGECGWIETPPGGEGLAQSVSLRRNYRWSGTAAQAGSAIDPSASCRLTGRRAGPIRRVGSCRRIGQVDASMSGAKAAVGSRGFPSSGLRRRRFLCGGVCWRKKNAPIGPVRGFDAIGAPTWPCLSEASAAPKPWLRAAAPGFGRLSVAPWQRGGLCLSARPPGA